MAFSEVRNYHFGDEVRTIDWNVTARYNDPYVKVFEEERELTVMLVIDVSGSEEFGTADKTKKDVALEIAAVLAFSAISNNDKVGAILVSDQVERFIAPEKGKKHALMILRELIEFKPKSKGTNLNEGLKFLRNTQKKRAITFVLSDFVDQNNFMEGMRLTKKRHDTIAIKLSDRAEHELPNMGFIQLYNAETGETTWVNSSAPEVREKFKQNFLEEEEAILKALETTPPELAADIYRRGLYITGGGSLLRGLDKRLSQKIKLPVHVADDPLKSVVRGTGIALKNYQRFPFIMR